MKRADWIASLNSYQGVKFQHQGRSRLGVDCIGLLACAAEDLGHYSGIKEGLSDYQRAPSDRLFKRRTAEFLSPLPYNRLQPIRRQILAGDVIIFWIDERGFPRHVAVYMGVDESGQDRMLHSYAKHPHCVLNMSMNNGYWMQRIDSLWRVPVLED